MATKTKTTQKPDAKLKQKIEKHKIWQRDNHTHRLLCIVFAPDKIISRLSSSKSKST